MYRFCVKKVRCRLGSGKVVPDPEPTCQKKVQIRIKNTGHKVGEVEQKAALNFKKGQRRELSKWD
jgi:hypothetical protein